MYHASLSPGRQVAQWVEQATIAPAWFLLHFKKHPQLLWKLGFLHLGKLCPVVNLLYSKL